MHTDLSLSDRIEGCLTGAAIGAALDHACHVRGDDYSKVSNAKELRSLALEPVSDAESEAYLAQRPYVSHARLPHLMPLIDIGVQAYLARDGRATPEDFGRALQGCREIADSSHNWWMLFYTTQELLGEGCNPRISGMGTAPSGLVAHSMPAVGIFHHHDPEYAYLDGVEMAGVCQPRLGTEWAGLAAGAIAAAFAAEDDPQHITRTVLDLAKENNEDLFRELEYAARSTAGWFEDEAKLKKECDAWLSGAPWTQREPHMLAPNPIRFVLPLLKLADRDPRLLMALLLYPGDPNHVSTTNRLGVSILGGAILGARRGSECFPETWRDHVKPTVREWLPIVKVVEERREREKAIIAVHEALTSETVGEGTRLEDKISGCILASSIGNAMGSPVESQSYEEIDAKYPDGITTILDPTMLETEDDNQQMMLLLETYVKRAGNPVMARHLAKTWCDQWSRAIFWPFADKNSYNLIRAGWDPRITGHWNGMGTSVMCIEPVGLYHIADPDYAVVDASAIAYMHVRGVEIGATSILAAAVTEALQPDATVDSVWDVALKVASRDWPLSVPNQLRALNGGVFKTPYDYLGTCREVAEKYDDVFAVREELYEKCLMFNWWQAAHFEIVALPLAILKVADGDVRQSAIGGTNIGRDADTNAGRAAMLAGALSGAANVPEEWMAMFPPSALERVGKCTRAMVDLISGEKLERLRRRQVT